MSLPSWMPRWFIWAALFAFWVEVAVIGALTFGPWWLVPVFILPAWPYRRPIWRGIGKVNAAMASAAEWWARGVD